MKDHFNSTDVVTGGALTSHRPVRSFGLAGLCGEPFPGPAALDGADLMRVELPDAPTARAMFRRRLERSPNRSAGGLAADADVIDVIVELCGRLPLALAILAGRLSTHPRLRLGAVAAELRQGLRKLAAFPSGHGLTDPRTTFSWSYRRLSPPAARKLLRELAEDGLLDEDDRGVFTCHVLVEACGEELLLATERAAALTRFLVHIVNRPSLAFCAQAPGTAKETDMTFLKAAVVPAVHG